MFLISSSPQDETIKYVATVIWNFKIRPSPSQQVPPSNPTPSHIDNELPPLHLDEILGCNCFTQSCDKCSCSFERQMQDISDNSETEECFEEAVSEPESVQESVVSHATTFTSNYDQQETVEQFKIKGSFWEKRYQNAFGILSGQLVRHITPQFRIFPEPDNLKDKNAQRFDVFDPNTNAWLPLGYCPLDKIPKLIKAQRKGEITNIKLESHRRRYIPRINGFKFEGVLSIVKRGKWAKNDLWNTYNSAIRVV